MNSHHSDHLFAGSIPELYDQLLVPLIFEPYAADLVKRLISLQPRSVLEIAAGTGVVTRAMAAGLSPATEIVGSDLNQPMIDHAVAVGTVRPVTWRRADALDLPFADATFDAVVCQFGVMFFPDRVKAMGEVRRVLRPGGMFLFSIWDRIETNEFAHAITDALSGIFPDDPPRFLDRTPHGYHDEDLVRQELTRAGFETLTSFEPLQARSRAASHTTPAIAYCQGTPLKDEIEARGADVAEVTAVAAETIARRFGRTDVDALIRGFVIGAAKT